MPYEREFAGSKGVLALLENKDLMDIIKGVRSDVRLNKFERLDLSYVKQPSKRDELGGLNWAVVVDGSNIEFDLLKSGLNNFAIININQCLFNIDNHESYLKDKFATQRQYNSIYSSNNNVLMLPLFAVSSNDLNTADLFRKMLYEQIKSMTNSVVTALIGGGEGVLSVFDTYKKIAMDSKKNIKVLSPLGVDEKMLTLDDFYDKESQSYCDKFQYKGKDVFITDLMGFHAMTQFKSSGREMTAQVMLTMEKLLMLNTIEVLSLVEGNYLSKTVFVVDGGLGVFGKAGWMISGIVSLLDDINKREPLVLFGLEKSGDFMNYFKDVDTYFKRKREPLKNGMFFHLDNKFIIENIKLDEVRAKDYVYGVNTYFGSKGFYKNKKSALFTLNIAYTGAEGYRAVNNGASVSSKVLDKILMILDLFSSPDFENACSLLSYANEGAAISSSDFGKSILVQL